MNIEILKKNLNKIICLKKKSILFFRGHLISRIVDTRETCEINGVTVYVNKRLTVPH